MLELRPSRCVVSVTSCAFAVTKRCHPPVNGKCQVAFQRQFRIAGIAAGNALAQPSSRLGVDGMRHVTPDGIAACPRQARRQVDDPGPSPV